MRSFLANMKPWDLIYHIHFYFLIQIGTTSPNPFDMSGMSSGVGGISTSASKSNSSHTGTKPKSTVETLLGEHSNLVNLDDLVTSGKQQGNVI